MNNKIDNISCSSYNYFLKNFNSSIQKKRASFPPELYFFQFMENVIIDVGKREALASKSVIPQPSTVSRSSATTRISLFPISTTSSWSSMNTT